MLNSILRPGPILIPISICCIATVVIVCWVACFSGCQKEQEYQASQSVTLVVSGDTAGWIVPCGCTSAQSGGLLRRATLIDNVSDNAEAIVADVGGAAAGVSGYHRTKFESILRGELAMGLAAHNLGQSELAFGPIVLREIMVGMSVPFISANVTDATGQAVFPAASTVKRGSSQFLLIGVVDPQYATKDFLVTDPQEAIIRTVETMRPENCAGIFVLAYCPQDRLLELANQLPEVDAIIGGPTGQTIAPQKTGATIVCSATNKGKFVVRLDRESESSGWEAAVVEVDESLADQPQQISNLTDFRERLIRADFQASTTAVGNFNATGVEGELQYSGNEACLRCHVVDSEHWATTRHAHAWDSLQPLKSFADPFCQQCHTTGYAQPGGFQNIASSNRLLNVGCESCHGPSSRHVAEPARRTPWQGRDQCIVCHDRENSPNFNYDEYWAKIVHGEKLDPSVSIQDGDTENEQ